MSNDAQNFGEPIYSGQVPPQPGLSTGSKVILGCGCGCGVILLLVCVAGYLFVQGASKALVTDPAKIDQMTSAITDIQVPSELSEKAAMDISSLPLVGSYSPVTSAVFFSAPDKDGVLILASAKSDTLKVDELEKQISDVTQQPNKSGDFKVTGTEELKRTIRGQESKFFLRSGTFGKENKPGYQLTGVFKGKSSPAFVMLVGSEPEITKAKAIAVLDSIK